MPDFSTSQIAACSAVAFIAGIIDAMAGGGGIFTMPVLAALGLPIPNVAGTNKFVGTSGSGTATASFLARGKLDHFTAGIVGLLRTALALSPGAERPHSAGKFDDTLTKSASVGLTDRDGPVHVLQAADRRRFRLRRP